MGYDVTLYGCGECMIWTAWPDYRQWLWWKHAHGNALMLIHLSQDFIVSVQPALT